MSPLEEKKSRTRTLYVSADDLEVWEKAKEYAGESLSQLVTNYLKGFVASKEAGALGKERIELRYLEKGQIPQAKAFYGRWVIPPEKAYDLGIDMNELAHRYIAAAISAKNKIVIFYFLANQPLLWIFAKARMEKQENYPKGELFIFDTLEEAATIFSTSAVAAIKTQLGVEVEELDI